MSDLRILLGLSVAAALAVPAIALLPFLGPSGATPAPRAPPPSVPPDGAAGPRTPLAAIASHAVALGSAVTTEKAWVTSVECPQCGSPTESAEFGLRGPDGSDVRARIGFVYQDTYNVKKQNWVPAVGWTVQVQGRVEADAEGWYVNVKRWGSDEQPGSTVRAHDISGGRLAEGTYVWLAPVLLMSGILASDGDFGYNVSDAESGKGFVHVELPPPFHVGGLPAPRVGDVVEPYGMVHYDWDNKWWEIHPVRCWRPGECAPATASVVQNGPVPGSPATGAIPCCARGAGPATGQGEEAEPEAPPEASGSPRSPPAPVAPAV